MKHRVGLGLTLAICVAVEAAEPVATSPVAAEPAPAAVHEPASKPVPPPAAKATVKPLDLRVGNVRKYMMPNEYLAVLGAPDAEKNTVVVEAKRELLPVEYEEPIPTWPLGPLWWGLKNPSQSWRIFLPDLNRPEDGPPDVVPPSTFLRLSP